MSLALVDFVVILRRWTLVSFHHQQDQGGIGTIQILSVTQLPLGVRGLKVASI